MPRSYDCGVGVSMSDIFGCGLFPAGSLAPRRRCPAALHWTKVLTIMNSQVLTALAADVYNSFRYGVSSGALSDCAGVVDTLPGGDPFDSEVNRLCWSSIFLGRTHWWYACLRTVRHGYWPGRAAASVPSVTSTTKDLSLLSFIFARSTRTGSLVP